MERAVAYLRVSTQRQQRSGLRIEAQRAAMERFVVPESLTIIEEYAEFDTGKRADALDRHCGQASEVFQAGSGGNSISMSRKFARDFKTTCANRNGLGHAACRFWATRRNLFSSSSEALALACPATFG